MKRERYILDSDDRVRDTFFTVANSSAIIDGLNKNATVTTSPLWSLKMGGTNNGTWTQNGFVSFSVARQRFEVTSGARVPIAQPDPPVDQTALWIKTDVATGNPMAFYLFAGGAWRPFASAVHTGMIVPFGGQTVPWGYLDCNGATLAQATWPDLYTEMTSPTLIWGSAGSGSFNVPDLRGRVLMGSGTGTGLTARTLYAALGAENIEITQEQLKHRHMYGEYEGEGDARLFKRAAKITVVEGQQTYRVIEGNEGPQSVTNQADFQTAKDLVDFIGTGGTPAKIIASNVQPSAVIKWLIKT